MKTKQFALVISTTICVIAITFIIFVLKGRVIPTIQSFSGGVYIYDGLRSHGSGELLHGTKLIIDRSGTFEASPLKGIWKFEDNIVIVTDLIDTRTGKPVSTALRLNARGKQGQFLYFVGYNGELYQLLPSPAVGDYPPTFTKAQ